MADFFQWFGNDFQINVNGSLLSVSGTTWTQQRIVRRLLTNPKTYLAHPTYGAGLGLFVGKMLSPDEYQAIINTCVSQILMEQAVAKTPRPVVTVNIIEILGIPYPQVSIEYFDLTDQKTVYLSFTVQN